MLAASENSLLCRVGADTPMGKLMRQYWLPALLSQELAEPDGRPVRILLLGEQLIAFRDSAGRVGLVAESCPHRGASLFFGRNEEEGLRCVYHGWKFDVSGCCVDMPNEPAESNSKDRVQAIAYPCVERGGIIWAYLGPPAPSGPPPLPLLEASFLVPEQRELAAYRRDCNWLQALEGDFDTTHVGFLHFGGLRPEDAPEGSFRRLSVQDRAPRLEVVDTEAGVMYAALRPSGADWIDCRIVQFLFPCYAMLEPGLLGLEVSLRAWVPMDDEHTMFFGVNKVRGQPESAMRADERTGFETLVNGSGPLDRFRLVANAGNDYLIDREQQKAGDYTGIRGIFTQDAAVTESMGAIVDRTQEHLGASDAMIIRVRQRLLAAVRELSEHGRPPPGAGDPQAYAVRSGGAWLLKGADWIEATRELRRAPIAWPVLDK
jgi:phthalate 4,5-dioxygenase oxygenase subunit